MLGSEWWGHQCWIPSEIDDTSAVSNHTLDTTSTMPGRADVIVVGMANNLGQVERLVSFCRRGEQPSFQALDFIGIRLWLETIPERKCNQAWGRHRVWLTLANVWNIAPTTALSEVLACSFVHSDV
ncbi:hypothetical protein MN608_08981 [Microdochium nivale]|nr:hypothetical protein MN608_08981 [Microdochium nivale]